MLFHREDENIRYTSQKATPEECEELWNEHVYKQLSKNLWVLEDPQYKDTMLEQPTEPISIESKRLALKCSAVPFGK